MHFFTQILILFSGTFQLGHALNYPPKQVSTDFRLFAYGTGISGKRVFAENGTLCSDESHQIAILIE